MIIRGLVDEDMVNYKQCSMFVIFPYCTFKCGRDLCQNTEIVKNSPLEIEKEELCKRYIDNSLTSAMVLGGLEPFDSPFDLISLVDCLRNKFQCEDDIVIYTGYTEEELTDYNDQKLSILYSNLLKYKNIIIKFGRYIPGQSPHFDTILGVNLISDNQYAKKVS